MASYYTIETIRDQILHNGWTVSSVFAKGSQHAVDIAESFPSDWNYCHCNAVALCLGRGNRTCAVRIGISTNNPNINTSLFIEIIYIRDINNGIGVVRENQMLLKKYIDEDRINRNALETIVI